MMKGSIGYCIEFDIIWTLYLLLHDQAKQLRMRVTSYISEVPIVLSSFRHPKND